MISIAQYVENIVEEVAGEMCGNYCKYKELYDDEDKLFDERCTGCPLSKL